MSASGVLDDGPCGLVPRDQRLRDPEDPSGSISVIVQVRAADTDIRGLEDELPRSRYRRRHVVDPQVVLAVDPDCAHGRTVPLFPPGWSVSVVQADTALDPDWSDD